MHAERAPSCIIRAPLNTSSRVKPKCRTYVTLGELGCGRLPRVCHNELNYLVYVSNSPAKQLDTRFNGGEGRAALRASRTAPGSLSSRAHAPSVLSREATATHVPGATAPLILFGPSCLLAVSIRSLPIKIEIAVSSLPLALRATMARRKATLQGVSSVVGAREDCIFLRCLPKNEQCVLFVCMMMARSLMLIKSTRQKAQAAPRKQPCEQSSRSGAVGDEAFDPANVLSSTAVKMVGRATPTPVATSPLNDAIAASCLSTARLVTKELAKSGPRWAAIGVDIFWLGVKAAQLYDKYGQANRNTKLCVTETIAAAADTLGVATDITGAQSLFGSEEQHRQFASLLTASGALAKGDDLSAALIQQRLQETAEGQVAAAAWSFFEAVAKAHSRGVPAVTQPDLLAIGLTTADSPIAPKSRAKPIAPSMAQACPLPLSALRD